MIYLGLDGHGIDHPSWCILNELTVICDELLCVNCD